MMNLFRIFTVAFILASAPHAFGFGGPECRGFEKATEKYFDLFYQTQDDNGVAHCKVDSDCILSAQGPCNRRELASKLKLNIKKLKALKQASKRYEELFEQCRNETCTKTRALAKGTKCTDGRCEFTYE
jgi:hypothetical protein